MEKERLFTIVGCTGIAAIGVMALVWMLFISIASTHNVSFAMAATQDTMLVEKEPEMVIELEEAEEPEEVTEENLATELQETAEQEVYEASIEEIAEEPVYVAEPVEWNGSVINPYDGTNNGPSGYETFYNMPMGGVVDLMRELGYDEVNYPYWVRDDGAKMFGQYVMVAANLGLRPKGTILESSLGTAMVCDTGGFAAYNPYQLDIAVTWVV